LELGPLKTLKVFIVSNIKTTGGSVKRFLGEGERDFEEGGEK
jgi:hypothetical protein